MDTPISQIELRAALAEFRLDLSKDLDIKFGPILVSLEQKASVTAHEALATRVTSIELEQRSRDHLVRDLQAVQETCKAADEAIESLERRAVATDTLENFKRRVILIVLGTGLIPAASGIFAAVYIALHR